MARRHARRHSPITFRNGVEDDPHHTTSRRRTRRDHRRVGAARRLRRNRRRLPVGLDRRRRGRLPHPPVALHRRGEGRHRRARRELQRPRRGNRRAQQHSHLDVQLAAAHLPHGCEPARRLHVVRGTSHTRLRRPGSPARFLRCLGGYGRLPRGAQSAQPDVRRHRGVRADRVLLVGRVLLQERLREAGHHAARDLG